jgi:hypothetical protein
MYNLARFPEVVKVIYPWSDDNNINQLTRIPPHASLLNHVHHIRQHQMSLVESFVGKVHEALHLQGYGPNQLTMESFNQMLQEFKNALSTHVICVMNIPEGNLAGGLQDGNDDVVIVDVPINEWVENGKTYVMHVFGRCHHWVPCDWT